MITEQELERALELKNLIKDLKIDIVRLETTAINHSLINNSKICIGTNTISVDVHTIAVLKRFRSEVIHAYIVKLDELQKEYLSIICSVEETFEEVLVNMEEPPDGGL